VFRQLTSPVTGPIFDLRGEGAWTLLTREEGNH